MPLLFEDLVLLDPKAIALVLNEADEADVALSLRGVSQQVRDHVFAGAGPELAARVTTVMEETGPVRLSDVERAQMRIVSIIRKLEQRGDIHIARVDETVL